MGCPTSIDLVLSLSQSNVQATTLRTPMAGNVRIELTTLESKSSVIPFHQSPTNLTWYYFRNVRNIPWPVTLFKQHASFLQILCVYTIFCFALRCSYCSFIHWHRFLLVPYRNTLLEDLFTAEYYSSPASLIMCLYMVGAVRLELTTYRLKADYSNQLSYTPILIPYSCHINAASLCLFSYVQPYLSKPRLSLLSLSITGSPI
jgi:hypothetical protein